MYNNTNICIINTEEGGTGIMRNLESDRLILRNWRISDLEDYHKIASNKKVSDLAGFRLKTNKVESLNTLEKFIAVSDDSKWEMKLKELNQLVFWAIELKEISRAIGWFELCEATWKVEEEKFKYAKEIGFVLGEEYWGQGLMPEAIKLVLNYLFEEEGIQAVMCSHFINNSQSEKVIKKCGFKFYREDDEEKYYYVNVGDRL
jgi:ribosomal-protein-alanine N-acetyltransferase